MKLIIDLPEEDFGWNGILNICRCSFERLIQIVSEGTPLEEQEPCTDAISRQELNEYKRAWERLEEAMDKLNPDIDSFSIKNNACLLVRQYKPSNEVIQEPCTDVISRQAVIEVLNKMDRYVADELTLCDTERKFPKNEVFIVDDVYEEIVEQLPSVKLKQRTGQWQRMSDLPEDEDDRYQCSQCGNVIHYSSKENLYTFSRWCGRCGSNNDRR